MLPYINLFLFFFFIFGGSSRAELLSDSFDFLLNEINAFFDAEDIREIEIPDLNLLSGRFNCTGGRVRDLGTLKRTGDIWISDPNPSVIINGSMGLTIFQIGFNHCELRVGGFHLLKQPMNVSVGKNSVRAQVTLKADDTLGCVGQVNDLNIVEFTGIRVETGSGIINGIEDLIIDATLDIFKNKILDAIVGKVQSMAEKAVEGGKLCSIEKMSHLDPQNRVVPL